MKPAKNLEKLIRNTKLDTNTKTDDAVLNDVIDALEQSKKTKLAVSQPDIWRIIMKSKITKFTAAAVIIIALVVGISHFVGSVESVAWADVTERFESVPFFNVTIYLCLGPYAQDQKMEIRKIEMWKSENGLTRIHFGNEVIFADCVDGNNVAVGFDSSTKQPLSADRMAKLANSGRGFLRAKKGEFSLDALLKTFPSDSNGITPVETVDTAASKETVLFEVKHKTTPTTQYSIWALRKSKLPMRASFRAPEHKIYADLLFDYSEKKDAAFFDPNAFAHQ